MTAAIAAERSRTYSGKPLRPPATPPEEDCRDSSSLSACFFLRSSSSVYAKSSSYWLCRSLFFAPVFGAPDSSAVPLLRRMTLRRVSSTPVWAFHSSRESFSVLVVFTASTMKRSSFSAGWYRDCNKMCTSTDSPILRIPLDGDTKYFFCAVVFTLYATISSPVFVNLRIDVSSPTLSAVKGISVAGEHCNNGIASVGAARAQQARAPLPTRGL